MTITLLFYSIFDSVKFIEMSCCILISTTHFNAAKSFIINNKSKGNDNITFPCYKTKSPWESVGISISYMFFREILRENNGELIYQCDPILKVKSKVYKILVKCFLLRHAPGIRAQPQTTSD